MIWNRGKWKQRQPTLCRTHQKAQVNTDSTKWHKGISAARTEPPRRNKLAGCLWRCSLDSLKGPPGIHLNLDKLGATGFGWDYKREEKMGKGGLEKKSFPSAPWAGDTPVCAIHKNGTFLSETFKPSQVSTLKGGLRRKSYFITTCCCRQFQLLAWWRITLMKVLLV